MKTRRYALALSALALAATSFTASAADHAFSNSTSIAIPAEGSGANTGSPASLYPSPITVSGLVDNVTAVTVTLHGMSHTFPDDVDILLVSPTGQQVTLMSDAGLSYDLDGVTLTFRADAATALPDNTAIGPGTYLPTNYGASDLYSAPAPASTGATDMAPGSCSWRTMRPRTSARSRAAGP